MSFLIPKKSFLSFSRKQLMDTFSRMAEQIVQGWHKEEYRINEINQLQEYIDFVVGNHPDTKLVGITKNLLPLQIESEQDFSEFILKIERLENKDIAEEDFLISTEDRPDSDIKIQKAPVHLVLDNLRSSFNIGSLFRSAESFGIDTIHLCGYSPTPENSKTAKSALGTQEWINWKYWESTFECLEELKKNEISIFSFETTKQSISLGKINREHCPNGAAIVLGNERYGLSQGIMSHSDYQIKIPMFGKKNSLNVGVCGAIALNHFRDLF